MLNELMILLDATLESHRDAISASHPPLDDILLGRCPVVLYPAARMATRAGEILRERGIDVRGFSDKDPAKWGQLINGLPIVSPPDIANITEGSAVLVASSLHDSVMREYLEGLGCKVVFSTPYLNYCLPEVFSCREYFQATEAPFRSGAREAILRLFHLLADDMSKRVLASKIRYYLTLDKRLLDGIQSPRQIYFDSEIVDQGDRHAVVDGGAFNGDTLRQYLATVSGHFQSYHAFEPDPAAFEALRRVAMSYGDRVECVRAGLSDQTGTLRFAVTGSADSAVVNEEDAEGVNLPVVALDSFFANREPPTLIKMDIEGSETAALHGAAGLIARCRPLLAVSAYHHPRDLWEIPLLINSLSPDYRIYLRHYTREIDDTVCYAIPSDRLQ